MGSKNRTFGKKPGSPASTRVKGLTRILESPFGVGEKKGEGGNLTTVMARRGEKGMSPQRPLAMGSLHRKSGEYIYRKMKEKTMVIDGYGPGMFQYGEALKSRINDVKKQEEKEGWEKKLREERFPGGKLSRVWHFRQGSDPGAGGTREKNCMTRGLWDRSSQRNKRDDGERYYVNAEKARLLGANWSKG